MYERFYNLRERPFALSPDPAYLYLSRVHREALDSIRYGVESRAGFIVITGDIGAGKTTLLQTLLQRLDERTTVARLVNTTLEPRELLEAIMLDFGIETSGKSKPQLLRELGQLLVQQRAQGRRPLLVIDEAQNLSAQALEEVRLLSNLETDKSKLLQILLAGQPNLRDTIASPQLEQFRQRVAVSYHLTPLDASETGAYINYRLTHAANGAPPQFSAEAADLVHRTSRGVPRIINVICDAALVFGYAEERRQLDESLIRDVLAELETTGILPVESAAEAAAAPAPQSPPRAAASSPAPSKPLALAEPLALADGGAAVLSADRQELALARAAEEATRRAAALSAREEALAQRERELAQQRRILAEEYRLLRAQRLHPPAGATGAFGGREARPAMSSPARFTSARPDGWRGRLKRLFSGHSHRAAEGS